MFLPEGETNIIVGKRNHLIKVDVEDFNIFDEYNIYVQCRKKYFRGIREKKKVMAWKKGTTNEDRVMVPLKKLIMGARKGQEVEHIDEDPLDLRKKKLKVTGNITVKKKKKLIKRY